MPAPSLQSIEPRSLYIHVPFCARKCAYCAFYSEASGIELMDRYASALVRELELVASDLRPRTVFFGGGTPSLLTLRQWERILRAMDRLDLLGAAEWTVECNPATVSLDKAKLLFEYGVNRISMGVQSLNEALLDRLGRIHSRTSVFKSFNLLRQAGFDNLNLDLMFAIPGQTMKIWQATLDEALAMESEHLSAYEVIYEEDTPLYAQLQSGEVDEDEDLACDMYEELVARATTAGFSQYEVANFARDRSGAAGEHPTPNEVKRHARGLPFQSSNAPALQDSIPALACQHNVNYWRGGSFYGLGPGATTYVRGVRTKNWPNTQLYCEQLETGKRAIESTEELSPLARSGETAAFGLRLLAGWPFEEFRNLTGFDLRDEWSGEMQQLVDRGWGRIAPDRFQLTRPGLRFADAAAEMFLC
ncbi:MAG: radical SAM family heme chaperone HemW [Verrucomicrobiota bacterium]|jgi:oxygen-independent coproporphyrinogen-3 oxidase